MILPNAEHALVAMEKVTDYLLSSTSPEGAPKEAFFTRFGFRADRWEEFAHALRAHCQRNDVRDIVATPHGMKYTVFASLETPDGRNPPVLTVWQIDQGDNVPRFITAIPPQRGSWNVQ